MTHFALLSLAPVRCLQTALLDAVSFECDLHDETLALTSNPNNLELWTAPDGVAGPLSFAAKDLLSH